MNVKKTVKRIAALAAGATMVSATVLGAAAYDLSEYPMPFVQDGMFEGRIVIGSDAMPVDILGAVDIAASLQQESVNEVDAEVGGSTLTATSGEAVQIKSNSEEFLFMKELDDYNSGVYDDDDFPELLETGTVEDDDNSDTDYDQTITVPATQMLFAQDDDEGGDDPVFHLDWNDGDYMTYTVDFDSAINLTEMTESQSMMMFGKEYTFDANHNFGDEITLYGSDLILQVSQNEPLEVQVGDEEYTITVLGGNSDDATAIIRVSGSTTDQETLEEGENDNLAGLDIYVDNVFINNIGGDTISVSLFIGSNKIVIPDTAIASTASYKEIEINGEDNTDIEAWVDGTDVDDVGAIHFRVDPTDFENSRTGEDWDWMVEEDVFTDNLFGIGISFEGFTPSMDSRDMVEFVRSGDVYSVAFTNNDGDEYDMELYQYPGSGTVLTLADDLDLGETNFTDGQIFLLNEDDTNPEDTVSIFYEIDDIDVDEAEVTLSVIGGTDKVYQVGDEVGDSGVTVAGVNDANFWLSAASDTSLVVEGGAAIALASTYSNGYNLTFTEDTEDAEDVNASSMDVLSFRIFHDTTNSDDDIVMSDPSWADSSSAEADQDGGDVEFGVSQFGTYYEAERDNAGDYLKIWNSEMELNFQIFLRAPNTVITSAGTSSGTGAYQINEMVAGQIALLDTEARSLLGNTPLIVVGGPCVNSIAATLMGSPEVCTEGFEAGKGKIVYFDDREALLVSGFSGTDTLRTSYVLADYSAYGFAGTELEVVTTDASNLEVNVIN